MAKRIAATFLALLCALAGYHFAVRESFVNPYPGVCDFVSKKIYLDDEKIKDWKRICLRRSRLVTPYSPKKLILQDLNNVFSLLNVSHLEIYDAKAVQNIWKGESSDTGIEGDFVESEFVVFKVHAGSPAEKAGMKAGDVIETLNGENPSSWTVASESGDYQILRGKEELHLKVQPGTFQRDDRILATHRERSIWVRVPSFRAEFFSNDKLTELARTMQSSKHIVVDLRGNAGGNFVAGLRFLSLFMCEPVEIGRLVKPRFESNTHAVMPDDLQDAHQLQVLEKHKVVLLKTFQRESCYRGRVDVLIDGKSSSVAEMVAQALKEFRKSLVAGAPSRGQLLVGVWYPMEEISAGVEVSIPEAYYESAKGRRIEGEGVLVDRTLYYKLPQMQAGIDSWVEELVRN